MIFSKKEYIIETYNCVGKIKLGMTIYEVREVLNSKYKEFKKTEFNEMNSDAFDKLGIHVHYKKPGICEAIELAKPASPIFNGEKLLQKPFTELKIFFEKIDSSVEINNDGLISYSFGIGLYAPYIEENPNEPVESVIVFEKDYYDDM